MRSWADCVRICAQASAELATAQQAAQKLARRLRSLRAERAALDSGALAGAALSRTLRACFRVVMDAE